MKYIGIFQGGGVKGIAHIGALKALEERGIFCVKAAGTSVGAIIASLVVSGYKANELAEIMFQLDIQKLKRKNSIIHTVRNLGIYSSSPLEEYLNNLYSYKNIKNFLDLKQGSDYLLKVVGTDITKRKKVIFPNDLSSYLVHPDYFPISKAVVMSATYPLFYKPMKLGSSIIMDGSLSSSFPIDVFGYYTDLPIIGFNLINNNKDYQHLNNPYIIRIPTLGVKSMDFSISNEIKKKLYLSGYNAGRKFLSEFFK